MVTAATSRSFLKSSSSKLGQVASWELQLDIYVCRIQLKLRWHNRIQLEVQLHNRIQEKLQCHHRLAQDQRARSLWTLYHPTAVAPAQSCIMNCQLMML
ncbi:uncharacterized protein LOC125551320 isoform X3 [Triticum urartu]|uniref:uncharacterized protein LOC125551320 isoform X3 n=1 Tax=Triticum urartu TaxID=4572 RepID=UPI002042FF8D|nr:uncharacterized protein LOC125551320 isoform X3 [Triticum urartu]